MYHLHLLATLALIGASVARRHPLQDHEKPIIKQTPQVKKFAVDGKALPEVDFDIGESYAGLLPISDEEGAAEIFFWFVPTENERGKDDITIWLNGGPGCSSLLGFLEENGPISWGLGTLKPVKNKFAWSNETNMIWVEQPAGVGFGNLDEDGDHYSSEKVIARHFLGFFKNFVDTFALKHKKIYITGESYAGVYIPYIGQAMLEAKDTEHFNLHGSMIYDGVFNTDAPQLETVTLDFVEYWKNVINLEDEQMDKLRKMHHECGYAEFNKRYFTYPPPQAPFPGIPKHCNLYSYAGACIVQKNPCSNIYNVLDFCPKQYDPLYYKNAYFAREDVQQMINVPVGTKWRECGPSELRPKFDRPTFQEALPRSIEGSKRTLIVHGNADMILLAKGTLLTIQNMTWNGKQGFQNEPCDKFWVPPYTDPGRWNYGGGAYGTLGVTHTERGLTWVETFQAGHMVPQYQPTAALTQLRFLLGRIDGLTKADQDESRAPS